MKRIYFAGPLFCQSEKEYNAKLTKVLEENGYSVFLPQRDGIEAATVQGKTEAEISDEIFRKDTSEILKADIFFMVLDGYVRDDGACVELGIAYASGKRCYGIKTDTRALELGLEINPMISGCLKTILRIGNGEDAAERLGTILQKMPL